MGRGNLFCRKSVLGAVHINILRCTLGGRECLAFYCKTYAPDIKTLEEKYPTIIERHAALNIIKLEVDTLIKEEQN